MKARFSTAAAILFLTAAASTAPAQNLLFNPSFEQSGSQGFFGGPDPFTATLPGWRLTGVGDGTPGNFSQLLGVANDQPLSGKDGSNFAYNVLGIFETLDVNRPAVVAGETYQFSFIAEADFDNIATSAQFSIDWYNSQSGYTPLSSTSLTIPIAENGGTFSPYAGVTGVAPVGATFAAVRYNTTIAAVGGTGANAWFDAASLTAVVPEPTTALSALALSGLMLARRRTNAR